MPTLAELAQMFTPSGGPPLGFTLADLTSAIDSRKKFYGNAIRSLLDDPAATIAQWRAQDAEQHRVDKSYVGGLLSVMPEMREATARRDMEGATNFGLLGMTAYHGSPHKFDKFDMSKIGTGEGAQAYGHGLYFAEKPEVADQYARNITEMHNAPKQHIYKVDIPDDAVSHMLDWDKQLSQQPAILEKVRKLVGDNPELLEELPKYTGEDLHKWLLPQIGIGRGGADDLKAYWLKKVGISGVRYLDYGSRSKGGTSNFVLFDDQLPKIIERKEK